MAVEDAADEDEEGGSIDRLIRAMRRRKAKHEAPEATKGGSRRLEDEVTIQRKSTELEDDEAAAPETAAQFRARGKFHPPEPPVRLAPLALLSWIAQMRPIEN